MGARGLIKSQCREWCKEAQEKLLPGVGNVDASRASFALPMPPIGACRGAKPLCVSSIPQEWGIKGVDKNQVGEPVAGIWRGVAVNALS